MVVVVVVEEGLGVVVPVVVFVVIVDSYSYYCRCYHPTLNPKPRCEKGALLLRRVALHTSRGRSLAPRPGAAQARGPRVPL